ncbi:MAG: hypothetical protein AAFR31_05025 [Cyanobacteria bacterium J06627_8]
MNRYLVSALTAVLTATAIAPSVRAIESIQSGPSAEYSKASDTYSDTTNDTQATIDPLALAFLAYRGELSDQGIPGYNKLTMKYRLGQITTQDVVAAAIEAGYLTDKALDDRAYISAVTNQLEGVVGNY